MLLVALRMPRDLKCKSSWKELETGYLGCIGVTFDMSPYSLRSPIGILCQNVFWGLLSIACRERAQLWRCEVPKTRRRLLGINCLGVCLCMLSLSLKKLPTSFVAIQSIMHQGKQGSVCFDDTKNCKLPNRAQSIPGLLQTCGSAPGPTAATSGLVKVLISDIKANLRHHCRMQNSKSKEPVFINVPVQLPADEEEEAVTKRGNLKPSNAGSSRGSSPCSFGAWFDGPPSFCLQLLAASFRARSWMGHKARRLFCHSSWDLWR